MLNAVTKVIADFYPTHADIRRVASDIYLPVSDISFDPKAINTARSLVLVAEEQGRLHELVELAYREHRGHMGIAELYGAIRYAPAADDFRREYRENSQYQNNEDLYVMVRRNSSKLDRADVFMLVSTISQVLMWITMIGILFALRYVPG